MEEYLEIEGAAPREIRDVLRLTHGLAAADALYDGLKKFFREPPVDRERFRDLYASHLEECADMETELGLKACILTTGGFHRQLSKKTREKLWEYLVKDLKETWKMYEKEFEEEKPPFITP